jgi:hypothetical protein
VDIGQAAGVARRALAFAALWRMIRHAEKSLQPERRPAVGLLEGTNASEKREEMHMRGHARLVVATLAAVGLLFLKPSATSAADPKIDALLRSPVGKDWITNGGNLTNQRYSTLKQIDRTNVKQLKGAWMQRLKSSGLRQVFVRGDAAGEGRHHVCRYRQR